VFAVIAGAERLSVKIAFHPEGGASARPIPEFIANLQVGSTHFSFLANQSSFGPISPRPS
jgi:hypothetical protein